MNIALRQNKLKDTDTNTKIHYLTELIKDKWDFEWESYRWVYATNPKLVKILKWLQEWDELIDKWFISSSTDWNIADEFSRGIIGNKNSKDWTAFTFQITGKWWLEKWKILTKDMEKEIIFPPWHKFIVDRIDGNRIFLTQE